MSGQQKPHSILETLNQVEDKDSFLKFVRGLIEDRRYGKSLPFFSIAGKYRNDN
jgi:hypothetical protein